ncbi:flavohemoglobin expression-modulating QEGLA motif protein [Novipirellula caenicola]|uniref:Flavohemoglobin expression-modulating QEGLA motif protein n=1 Tax=Novipirellula caenicola TaxID=1536901 RepID=A0ABP9VWU8_9BACT
MKPTSTPPQTRLDRIESEFDAITDAVCARLSKNDRVRRTLPGDGRLKFDRQLPFLCVYRSPVGREDVGTRELVTTEAAYLFSSADPKYHSGLVTLTTGIGGIMQEHFGTFLFVEIWSSDASHSVTSIRPSFEIVSPDLDALPSTMEVLENSLKEISIHGRRGTVTKRSDGIIGPPDTASLAAQCNREANAGCCTIGIAVKPVYRDARNGSLYPVVLQSFRRQLATALRKTIAEFTGSHDPSAKVHFESLGPSSLVKATRLIDQQLCNVSESFDFLLQVTPTNADEAWQQFHDNGYCELPPLYYRPLPYHPNVLKRRLFDIEIERVEDPTLAHLFWEKQNELDRQLTALRDLDQPEKSKPFTHPSPFLSTSLQLYGRPEQSLLTLAKDILQTIHPTAKPKSKSARCMVSEQIVQRAHDEIDYYHTKMNEFTAVVEVSDAIASGIMVSQDRLLISSKIKLAKKRVESLLHHEIGTHLLTYFNGRCQPFQQLYAGLAGYEELQEGLAVLAEYLCGGLTKRRLRTLAARVIAVDSMVTGKSFVETFRLLHKKYRFAPHTSFTTTLRVYRGGGYTKDLIYLRGLRDLLDYLGAGHEIEPLYVGKIGLQHVPYVQELRRRGIITPSRILPRFWNDARIRDRLEACRGKSVLDLMETDR